MAPRIHQILRAALSVVPLILPLLFLTENNSWTTGLSIVFPDIVLGLPLSIGVFAIGPSLSNALPSPYDHIIGFLLLSACLVTNSHLLIQKQKISWQGMLFFSISIALVQTMLTYNRAFD